MNKIPLFLLVFLFSFSAEAQRRLRFASVNSIDQWEETLDIARNNGRLIFVKICSDWSQICRNIDRSVFRDRELASYFNEYYISVEIDGETEFGDMWKDRFDLPGYPVFMYVSPGEKVFARLEGFQEGEEIMKVAQDAVITYREYPRLRRAYVENGLSNAGWLKLIELEAANEGAESARPLFQEYLERIGRDAWMKTETLKLIAQFGASPNEELFQWVKENQTELRARDDFDREAFFEASFNHSMARAIRQKNEQKINEIEEHLYIWTDMSESDRTDQIWEMRRTYFLRTGEWEKFSEFIMKKAQSEKNGGETLLALEARFIIENFKEPQALNVAAELMNESIKQKDSFEKRVFLASAFVDMQEYNKAIEVLDEAKKATRDPYDHYEIEELKNRVRQIEKNRKQQEAEKKEESADPNSND